MKPELPQSWRCTECDEVHDRLLTADNPFGGDEIIHGCPRCFSVECFRDVCQVPECNGNAVAGVPNFREYRYARLCRTHCYEETDRQKQ